MAEKTEVKKPSLNRIIAQINKKAGENVIGRLGDMQNISGERIPCGISKLDEAVGGGFPTGKMIELYGLPSSGKSLIAQLIVGQAQKLKGECVWVDAEGSFDPVFAKSLGVDTEKLVLLQTGVGEDIIDTITELLKAEPMVIVVDSIGAMITRDETEESVEKVFMAPKARLLSKGLAKLTALNKNTLLVFINQLRKNVSLFGPSGNTTMGGMALGFYASIRVEVKRDREFLHIDGKKSGEIIGQIVQFNVAKNKTFAPYKTGSFKFFFDGHFE